MGVRLDKFTEAYIECALWSTNDESTPDGGEPMDNNYGVSDVANPSLAYMIRDCQAFQRDHADDLAAHGTDEQCGHDFWLTRNGHGAGFWDRGTGEVGARLTAAAKRYGSCDLYVGDDRQIYVSGGES